MSVSLRQQLTGHLHVLSLKIVYMQSLDPFDFSKILKETSPEMTLTGDSRHDLNESM